MCLIIYSYFVTDFQTVYTLSQNPCCLDLLEIFSLLDSKLCINKKCCISSSTEKDDS